MACVTGRSGWYVVIWFEYRSAGVVLHVALGAFPWRTLEDAVDVTRLASHSSMRTTQLETGTVMLKLTAC
jgi:hypothetical protein